MDSFKIYSFYQLEIFTIGHISFNDKTYRMSRTLKKIHPNGIYEKYFIISSFTDHKNTVCVHDDECLVIMNDRLYVVDSLEWSELYYEGGEEAVVAYLQLLDLS